MAKARYKGARTVKGWRARAPKTRTERRELLMRCGAKAFLDPKRLKFPIMAKDGPCVVDCAGLRSAKARAAQFKHTAVARKAEAKGKSARCSWA